MPAPPLAFRHYVALGDSISIDIYPAADVARRFPGKASSDRLGASSLLHKNDDRLWPEFKGRDLSTLHPTIRYEDLASDGATTETLVRQVERVRSSDEPTLATITIGGNDLLGLIGSRTNPVKEIADRLTSAVRAYLDKRPDSIVLLTTVYDPSDGTNRLPDFPGELAEESKWLRQYHDRLHALVTTDERLKLADITSHFQGHGVTAPLEEQWYLRESIIEPNARGASEVRRVWLRVLGIEN